MACDHTQPCGCNQDELTTLPDPCDTTPCIDGEPCDEIIDCNCVRYNGTPIPQLDIAPGDSLCDIITDLIGLGGVPGASAYDIWIAEGNEGTEQDFLDSLIGEDGITATVDLGLVNTGLPGTSVIITNTGPTPSDAIFNFTIPRGDKGDQGDKGDPGNPGATGNTGPAGSGTNATVTVGTTTTSVPGTNALVTNSGTSSAAIFNFTIPRGDTGAQGIQGLTGATGAPGAGGSDDLFDLFITTIAHDLFSIEDLLK